MTWTFTGNPATDDKDALRVMVGDTDSTDQLVSDETVLWALTQFSNRFTAAAFLCDTIASGQSSDGLRKIGDLQISGGRSATSFTAKAKTFRRLAALSATPFAGGISVNVATGYQTDADIPKPAFSIGQFDSPEAPGQGGSLTYGTTST